MIPIKSTGFGWIPVLAILLHEAYFGAATYYEAQLFRRQAVLEAMELPCGSDKVVQSGEKFLFDSRTAISYETSGSNSYSGSSGGYRRRRSLKSNNPAAIKVQILTDTSNSNSNSNPQQNSEQQVKKGPQPLAQGRAYVMGSSYGSGSKYGGGYVAPSYASSSGSYQQGAVSYYPSGQTTTCQWTFRAGTDCALEAHITRFKYGDTNCYKQQFIVSDNHTELTVCGYEKLHPSFYAETPVLIIKYVKQPYVYRHVFKGYVTCAKRTLPASYYTQQSQVDYNGSTGTYTSPAVSYTHPATDYAYPTANYTSPPVSYTYPAANYTYPAANYTYPAAYYTYPEANYTYPAANYTYPAANYTYPEANYTYSAANYTYPAANYSYPAANYTYPAANYTYQEANYTNPAANYNYTSPAAVSGTGAQSQAVAAHVVSTNHVSNMFGVQASGFQSIKTQSVLSPREHIKIKITHHHVVSHSESDSDSTRQHIFETSNGNGLIAEASQAEQEILSEALDTILTDLSHAKQVNEQIQTQNEAEALVEALVEAESQSEAEQIIQAEAEQANAEVIQDVLTQINAEQELQAEAELARELLSHQAKEEDIVKILLDGNNPNVNSGSVHLSEAQLAEVISGVQDAQQHSQNKDEVAVEEAQLLMNEAASLNQAFLTGSQKLEKMEEMIQVVKSVQPAENVQEGSQPQLMVIQEDLNAELEQLIQDTNVEQDSSNLVQAAVLEVIQEDIAQDVNNLNGDGDNVNGHEIQVLELTPEEISAAHSIMTHEAQTVHEIPPPSPYNYTSKVYQPLTSQFYAMNPENFYAQPTYYNGSTSYNSTNYPEPHNATSYPHISYPEPPIVASHAYVPTYPEVYTTHTSYPTYPEAPTSHVYSNPETPIVASYAYTTGHSSSTSNAYPTYPEVSTSYTSHPTYPEVSTSYTSHPSYSEPSTSQISYTSGQEYPSTHPSYPTYPETTTSQVSYSQEPPNSHPLHPHYPESYTYPTYPASSHPPQPNPYYPTPTTTYTSPTSYSIFYTVPNTHHLSESETPQNLPSARSYEEKEKVVVPNQSPSNPPSPYPRYPATRPQLVTLVPSSNPPPAAPAYTPQVNPIVPGSVILTYPYTAAAGSFIPPQIPPSSSSSPPQRNGYQYLISSATNPNIKYLVTCSLPHPYPCSPVAPIQQIVQPQSQIPVTAPAPLNVVYGR